MLSEKQKIAIKLVKFRSKELIKKGFNPDEVIEKLEKIKDTDEDFGGNILNWFSWLRAGKNSISFADIDNIISNHLGKINNYHFSVRFDNFSVRFDNRLGYFIGCQELTEIDKLENLLNGEITDLQLSESIFLKRSGKSIYYYFYSEKGRALRNIKKVLSFYKKLNSYLTNQTD